MIPTGIHWSSDRAVQGSPYRVIFDSIVLAAGVAAVVLALAVSHGASALVKGSLNGLDPDTIVVVGAAPSASGVQDGFVSSSLTSDDVVALGNAGFVPDASSVAPTSGLQEKVASLNRSAESDVIGSTSAFALVRGYTVAQGRFITQTDLQARAPVVVLGQTLVSSLFSGANPVGRAVEIASQNFQVVGTLRARGYSGSLDQDDLVVMPITTAWSVLFSGRTAPIDQVLIRADNPSAATAAAEEATTTLLQRHNIANPAQADFTVQTEHQLAAARIATAIGVKRSLEIAGLLLLLAGALQLHTVETTFRLEAPRRLLDGSDEMATLSGVLYSGLVGSGVGVFAALCLAPAVHRLAPGLPHAGVTPYAVMTGLVVGVAAAALCLLPEAIALAGARLPRLVTVLGRTEHSVLALDPSPAQAAETPPRDDRDPE